jgi:hypothetical protein
MRGKCERISGRQDRMANTDINRALRYAFSRTVMHASRDIPSRLAELQPMLAAEVDVLRERLRARRRR